MEVGISEPEHDEPLSVGRGWLMPHEFLMVSTSDFYSSEYRGPNQYLEFKNFKNFSFEQSCDAFPTSPNVGNPPPRTIDDIRFPKI